MIAKRFLFLLVISLSGRERALWFSIYSETIARWRCYLDQSNWKTDCCCLCHSSEYVVERPYDGLRSCKCVRVRLCVCCAVVRRHNHYFIDVQPTSIISSLVFAFSCISLARSLLPANSSTSLPVCACYIRAERRKSGRGDGSARNSCLRPLRGVVWSWSWV